MTSDDYSEFPLREFLGMSLELLDVGSSRATIDVTEDVLNPNLVVHGGVLFTMVDTAMGHATMSVLEEGKVCATIEIHLRFLRPAKEGRLVVDAKVVQSGSRIVQLEAVARTEAGRVLAMASGSFAVISGTT